jgi:hypothetical protein
MATYSSGIYGFNPGYGYLTEGRKRGQTYNTQINLGDLCPAAGYLANDTVILMETRATTRIESINCINMSAQDLQVKMSFGWYDSSGQVEFPKYAAPAAFPNDYCDSVLVCGVGANGLAVGVDVNHGTDEKLYGDSTFGFRGDLNNGGAGNPRTNWSYNETKLFVNNGEILDAALKGPLLTQANDAAIPGVAPPYAGAPIPAGRATGAEGSYSQRGVVDTRLVLLLRTLVAIPQVDANRILIEVNEITPHTSQRSDGERFIKSVPSGPMDGVAPPNLIPYLP